MNGIKIALKIFPTSQDVFQFSAEDFCQRAVTAVKNKGFFSVVLSGGHTPEKFFDILASVEHYKNNTPWHAIRFFFGDERYVSSDDEKSNYHMAYEHLFSKVPVDPKNVHRISTDFKNSDDAAQHYEQILRSEFHLQQNEFPQFDLVYLGLGANAHTASLMPLSDIVIRSATDQKNNHQNTQLVAALFVEELKMYRITLTPNSFNHSKEIIFLVTGAEKASAVWNVLEGPRDSVQYPAQLIAGVAHKTTWYCDQDAAGKLNLDHLSEYKK